MREFFPFKYYDELRRKWIRARYVAELAVIADRYEQWEVTGPPELRSDTPLEPHNSPPPHTNL